MASLFCCRAPRSDTPPVPSVIQARQSQVVAPLLHRPECSGSSETANAAEGSDDTVATTKLCETSYPDKCQASCPGPSSFHEKEAQQVSRRSLRHRTSLLQEIKTHIRKHISKESFTSRNSSNHNAANVREYDNSDIPWKLDDTPFECIGEGLFINDGDFDTDAHSVALSSYLDPVKNDPGTLRTREFAETLKRSQNQDKTSSIRLVTDALPSLQIELSGPDGIDSHSLRGSQSRRLFGDEALRNQAHKPEELPAGPHTEPLEIQCSDDASGPETQEQGRRPGGVTRILASSSSVGSLVLPPAPLLQPLRLPSLSVSGSQSIWRLSRPGSDSRGSPVLSVLGLSGQTSDTIKLSRVKEPSLGPGEEDGSFGGVDGHRDIPSPASGVLHPPNDAHGAMHRRDSTEGQSGGGNKGHTRDKPSLHLYNMRISQRLASQSSLQGGSVVRGHNRGQSSISTLSLGPSRLHRHSRTSSLGFASSGVPPSWGTVVQDAGSSVYPSEEVSRIPTPEQSVQHLPASLDGHTTERLVPPGEATPYMFSTSPDNKVQTTSRSADGHNRNSTMVSSNDSEGLFESETDSYRARELEFADIRFTRRHRSANQPLRSRFREEFDETFPESEMLRSTLHGPRQPPPSSSLPTVGHYNSPHQPRKAVILGCTDGGTEDEASIVWGRAFQRQAALRDIAAFKEGGVTPHHYATVQPRQLEKRQAVALRKSHSWVNPWVRGQDRKLPGAVSSTKTPGSSTPNHDKGAPPSPCSESSWARYPSHTRHERNSSAGEEDHVAVRDFDTRQSSSPARLGGEQSSEKRLDKGKRRNTRSMTFGKKISRAWGRFYRSKSIEFKLPDVGPRSSIATGGLLQYPELEILAPTHSFPNESPELLAQIAAHNRALFNRRGLEERHAVDEEGGDAMHEGAGAPFWSYQYQDCIEHPRASEEGSAADDSSSERYVTPASRRTVLLEMVNPAALSVSKSPAVQNGFSKHEQYHVDVEAPEQAV